MAITHLSNFKMSSSERKILKASKPKRLDLTLEQKVDIINTSAGQSQRQLAEKFNCGKTQIHSILKRKADILEQWESNMNSHRKRICKRPLQELEDDLSAWFNDCRARLIPLSGPMIQQKALLLAKKNKISDFKASNGWLDRFKKAQCISYKSISGERGDVNLEQCEEWKSRLPSLVEGYNPSDIYNLDETGIFYRYVN